MRDRSHYQQSYKRRMKFFCDAPLVERIEIFLNDLSSSGTFAASHWGQYLNTLRSPDMKLQIPGLTFALFLIHSQSLPGLSRNKKFGASSQLPEHIDT
jgi:hypothetical protein